MRSHLLIGVTMVIAIFATVPLSAEEIAATDQTEAMNETMDPGMAEAAAEQEAMESEMSDTSIEPPVQVSTEESADVDDSQGSSLAEEPADETAQPATEEPSAEDSDAKVHEDIADGAEVSEEGESVEVVTGTVIETSGPAAKPSKVIDMPQRGLRMSDVEKRYGKPMGINAPVGDPPIIRWDYPGYAVYFEKSYVIDSVQK
ncbi:MAG: hypothetical protein OEZ16_07170 [Chromatiales bacterium]|nr:hypothetical protein [Chromatiales bacterium]